MSPLEEVKIAIAEKLRMDGLEPELREVIKQIDGQVDTLIALKGHFEKNDPSSPNTFIRSEKITTKHLVVHERMQVGKAGAVPSLIVNGKIRIEGKLNASEINGMLTVLSGSVASHLNNNPDFRRLVKGDQGTRGATGPQGAKGAKGSTGQQGPPGDRGPKGGPGRNA